MITLRPVRRVKRLIRDLPRDEQLRAQQLVREGGTLPRPTLEDELARFIRVVRYANYW